MPTPRSAARRRAAPDRAPRAPRERTQGAERRIALSPLERDLLQRACARYRSALPSYLASARTDLRLLAQVLRKLR